MLMTTLAVVKLANCQSFLSYYKMIWKMAHFLRIFLQIYPKQKPANTSVRVCSCTNPKVCISSWTGTTKPWSKQREFKRSICCPPFIPSSLEHSEPEVIRKSGKVFHLFYLTVLSWHSSGWRVSTERIWHKMFGCLCSPLLSLSQSGGSWKDPHFRKMYLLKGSKHLGKVR